MYLRSCALSALLLVLWMSGIDVFNKGFNAFDNASNVTAFYVFMNAKRVLYYLFSLLR